MADRARRTATYDDVLAAPEGMTAEILNGELHLSPRPSIPHQVTSASMVTDVMTGFSQGRKGPGGWVILHEVELHLGGAVPRSLVVVPDLAAWRKERMPRPPPGSGVELAPDWVCGILSPGAPNVRRDRLIKAEIYHRAGVPWMWIVDPLARTIEVFQRADAGWLRTQTHAGEGEARLAPFDAVAFDIGAWWPPSEEDG